MVVEEANEDRIASTLDERSDKIMKKIGFSVVFPNSSLVSQGKAACLIIITHRYYPRDIVGTYPPSEPNIALPTWQDWVQEGMYDCGYPTQAGKSTSSRTPDIDDPSGAFRMRDGLNTAIHSCKCSRLLGG